MALAAWVESLKYELSGICKSKTNCVVTPVIAVVPNPTITPWSPYHWLTAFSSKSSRVGGLIRTIGGSDEVYP